MKSHILLGFVAIGLMAVAQAADKVKELKDLDCISDQIPKFDGQTWSCASDETARQVIGPSTIFSRSESGDGVWDVIPIMAGPVIFEGFTLSGGNTSGSNSWCTNSIALRLADGTLSSLGSVSNFRGDSDEIFVLLPNPVLVDPTGATGAVNVALVSEEDAESRCFGAATVYARSAS